jgi:hypothetical protein
MPSPVGLVTTFRRLAAVVATAAVLLTATVSFAQAAKKEEPAPKSKNYSIPWVVTVLCLAGLVVPVAMATQRKWEMPFEDDDEDQK